MCGVVGIYSHKPVAQDLYDSLIHLQHRGQDAAGILTYDGKFHQKRGWVWCAISFRNTAFCASKATGASAIPATLPRAALT